MIQVVGAKGLLVLQSSSAKKSLTCPINIGKETSRSGDLTTTAAPRNLSWSGVMPLTRLSESDDEGDINSGVSDIESVISDEGHDRSSCSSGGRGNNRGYSIRNSIRKLPSLCAEVLKKAVL